MHIVCVAIKYWYSAISLKVIFTLKIYANVALNFSLDDGKKSDLHLQREKKKKKDEQF
jgi:hypothetical protein